MAKEIIAQIKLAPGEVGFYDPNTRIYLTMQSPYANVYAGMNCTQLKRSVASGRLKLISGSFSKPIKQESKQVVPKKQPVAEVIEQEIAEEKEAPQKVEPVSEVIEAPAPVEELVTLEEVKPKRNRSRKKAESVEKEIKEEVAAEAEDIVENV